MQRTVYKRFMINSVNQAEILILEQARRLAPELGWNRSMFERAVLAAGLELELGELVLPDGVRDLATLHAQSINAGCLARLDAHGVQPMKIRDKIRHALLTHLDEAARHEEATRRWAGFLALPQNAGLSRRLVWEAADMIWRWCGDRSTDENHYSKRFLVSGIILGALGLELSHGRLAATAFVDARIANVMAFEKWKAQQAPFAGLPDLIRSVARRRYAS